jgi:hypothetical protein
MPAGFDKFQVQESVGKDYAPANAKRCCMCPSVIPRQDEYCGPCYRMEVSGQKANGMYAPEHTVTEVPPVPKVRVV